MVSLPAVLPASLALVLLLYNDLPLTVLSPVHLQLLHGRLLLFKWDHLFGLAALWVHLWSQNWRWALNLKIYQRGVLARGLLLRHLALRVQGWEHAWGVLERVDVFLGRDVWNCLEVLRLRILNGSRLCRLENDELACFWVLYLLLLKQLHILLVACRESTRVVRMLHVRSDRLYNFTGHKVSFQGHGLLQKLLRLALWVAYIRWWCFCLDLDEAFALLGQFDGWS